MEEFATLLIREKLLQLIFAELNKFAELKPSVDIIIKYIKILTTCSSVAVRLLKEDEGAPYYAYDGFSEQFIQHENDICFYDSYGDKKYKEDGSCLLQCMCGVILNNYFEGRYLLTKGGSFYTNNSSKLVVDLTETEKKILNIRGYCNECGYESIALIPIRYDDAVIGLLQINDEKSDKFDEESINYLENIGVQLGASMKNRKLYTDLLLRFKKLSSMVTQEGS